MSHYKANLRDIEFNLFEVLGIGALLEAGAYGDLDTETARGMLTEVQRLAEGPVAESFVDADRNPISFDAAEHEVIVPDPLRKTVAAVNEAGWSGLGMPEDMGGVDAPSPLIWAIQEMLVAANNSASFFNMGPLMHQVLYREGTEEQRRWAEHAWEKPLGRNDGPHRTRRRIRCRHGPHQGRFAARRDLAHRRGEALHLRW